MKGDKGRSRKLLLATLAVAAAAILWGCASATATPTPTAGPIIVSARMACLEVKEAMEARGEGAFTDFEYVEHLKLALSFADAGDPKDPAVIEPLRRWNESVQAALAGQPWPPQAVQQAAKETALACNPHFADMGMGPEE